MSKSFGPTRALVDVDLDLFPGEVHALVGENGAGKSTLLKILSGAQPADEGLMELNEQDYAPADPAEGRSSGLAMIYQELSLASHLTVEENILLGLEPVRGPMGLFVDRRVMRERARAALARIGRGDIDPATPVRELSVSDQQLVEIARAIAVGCRVLLLDEPTSSLTRQDVARLFDLIRDLRAEGIAIAYISHAQEEIAEIADRYTVLRDGEVVGTGLMAEADMNEIIQLMVGRVVDELYPRSARSPGEPLLAVRGLRGAPKPIEASLELHRGEVLGIAGLVGAGRTEMLRTLIGLEPLIDGEVRVGSYRGPLTPPEAWQQGLGVVSEDRKSEGLAQRWSIRDNITLPRLEGLGPRGLVLTAEQDRAVQPWIDKFRIKCLSGSQSVESLSGGNQQKVALARLMHADVDVLLLDEPTRGIDVGSKAEIYQWIDALTTGERPRAILMISSYLPELLGICDRIAVMCRGRLGPARPVIELTEHSIMQEATKAGDLV